MMLGRQAVTLKHIKNIASSDCVLLAGSYNSIIYDHFEDQLHASSLQQIWIRALLLSFY
jgi:hypothetical protein